MNMEFMKAVALSVFGQRKFSCAVLALLAGVSSGAVSDLRITEVNPSGDLVEVTHIGNTTFTLASNLPFSHKSNTLSFIPLLTQFAPGESKIFPVLNLDDNLSDLWLYRDMNFASPSSIISGLQWGVSGQDAGGRTSVAVAAGIWSDIGDFVAPQTSSALTLRLTSFNFTEPEPWEQGTPSIGEYFGTGEPIENPLPDILFTSVRVDLAPIATGLVSPITVAQPDDGTDRLFICDQVGKIHVIQNGTLLPTPLLDVTSRLVEFRNFDERGLLGMALHPNFAANPKIYTLTSEPKGDILADFPSPEPEEGFDHQGVLAEWTIDSSNPNIVDVNTRREIFRVDEPQRNHNGGTLHFGPEGYLYISLGDGGNRDDEGEGHLPDGNAQFLTNPLGKLLRIQIDGGPFPNGKYGVPADNPFVDVAGAIDEIWCYGLRNPFFFSFDRGGTNQLIVGDVGQGQVEEINIVNGGENFGWRLKEGTFFFDANTTGGPGFVTDIPVRPLPPEPLVDPIAQYDHDDGISIIGGFVYRGSTFPELQGNYIFGDFGTEFSEPTGRLFYLNDQGEINALTIGSDVQELNLWVKGFGEDESGEVYLCGSETIGPAGNTGVVLKLVGPTAAEGWGLYE